METQRHEVVVPSWQWSRATRRLGMAGAVCNGLLWAYVLWRVRPSVDPTVLHATIYFGIDRVGEWWRMYFVPLSGLIVLGANVLLANVLRRDSLVAVVLLATAGLSQVILGLALAAVL